MADEPEKKKDDKAVADDNGQENGEKKSSGNMIFIIILVAVLVVNGAVAFLLIQLTKPKKEPEEVVEAVVDTSDVESVTAPEEPALSETPIDAIVNIAGTDGSRFLKVAVIFEYDAKKYKDFGAELTALQVKHKDLLIRELSLIPLDVLSDPEKREDISKRLLNVINRSLKADAKGKGKDKKEPGQISAIYFDNFIIQ